MASFRRTPLPAYRHHRHQVCLPVSSSPLPFPPAAKYSSAPSPLLHSAPASGSPWTWRRPHPLALLCFLLGFFGGLLSLDHLDLDLDLDGSSRSLPLRPHVQVDTAKLVSVELSGSSDSGPAFPASGAAGKKPLIVVTPTHNRALQAYYLTRLGQTLRLVPPPLLWIVVEMGEASVETAEILRQTGVVYRHLVCRRSSSAVKDRGVHQRSAALDHIERHRLEGIVYFADDDNIYSLELFEHMRGIRNFGTWPVAMLAQNKAKAVLEGPVCRGSQVIGWHTNEKSKRLGRFHVDMSGFAFNSTMLWDPKKRFHLPWSAIRQLDTVKEGFQETTFIEQLVEDESEMEGIPPDCSRIMNWHLHLKAKHLVYPKGWQVSQNLDVVMPLKQELQHS